MAARNEFLGLFGESEETQSDSARVTERGRGDLILRQINAIDRSVGFIETIRANELPTRHQLDFTFHRDSINPEIFPESIADYILVDQVESVDITMVYELDETQSDDTTELDEPQLMSVCTGFSIDVTAADRNVVISRNPAAGNALLVPIADTIEEMMSHGSDTLLIGSNAPRDIEKIPRADITRLVLGLITKRPVEKDVSSLNDFDIYSQETAEKLQNALMEAAPQTVEYVNHEFAGGRSVNYRQDRVNDQDHLREITLRYETGNPERSVRCTIDFTDGLHMSFATIESTSGMNLFLSNSTDADTPSITPFSPNTSDINRLSEVMRDVEQTTQQLTENSVGSMAPHALDEMGSLGIQAAQAFDTRYGSSPNIDNDEDTTEAMSPSVLDELSPAQIQITQARDNHYGETSHGIDVDDVDEDATATDDSQA